MDSDKHDRSAADPMAAYRRDANRFYEQIEQQKRDREHHEHDLAALEMAGAIGEALQARGIDPDKFFRELRSLQRSLVALSIDGDAQAKYFQEIFRANLARPVIENQTDGTRPSRSS